MFDKVCIEVSSICFEGIFHLIPRYEPINSSAALNTPVKLPVQLHKMWDKVEVECNNGVIDEKKAGDVTNNIFGTERHCLTHRAAPAPPQWSLLLRLQQLAHLEPSAVSHSVMSSAPVCTTLCGLKLENC